MKFRKTITLVVALVMVFGMSQVPVQAQTATDVNIGLLTPLTGALGSLGGTFENGAQLAVDQMNANQSDYNFILDVGDTETSSSAAQTAASTLVSNGAVGIVGAAASSSTLAAITEAKAAGIPLISYASTSPAITDNNDDDLLFRVVPSDALQGQAASSLANELGVSDVAVIGIDDSYGQGLANAFVAAFEGSGGTITAQISYDQETVTDFSSQVTTLVDSDPEAIFMVSFIEDGQSIITELDTAGYDGFILGSDGIASPTLVADEGMNSTAIGVMGTSPTLTGNPTFNTAYETAYGTSPTIFVPEAYDATMVLMEAYIEKETNTAVTEWPEALRAIGDGYEGASGTITFDSNGDRTGGIYDIWQFQGDSSGLELTVIGEWEDGSLTITESIQGTAQQGGGDETEEDPIPLNFTTIFFGIMVTSLAVGLRRRKD